VAEKSWLAEDMDTRLEENSGEEWNLGEDGLGKSDN